MKRMNSLLPDDIAIKIASSLEVSDLCRLGSCSRFWREICGSDCLWADRCRDRWPALGLDVNSRPPHHPNYGLQPLPYGWKSFYTMKHREMAGKAAAVKSFIEGCLSYEVVNSSDYLKAIQDMCTMQFGFKDVELFFMKGNVHVVLNLAALHYCISWLQVPAEDVTEALCSHGISERQVLVEWWKPGGWMYRFRRPDYHYACCNFLRDLVLQEDAMLGMLKQGVTREVLRIQIYDASVRSSSS